MRLSHHTLALCALLTILSGPAVAAKTTHGEAFFSANAFYGRGGHLAIPGANSVKAGERVLVFEPQKAPAWTTVSRVMPTQEAKKVFDKLGFAGVYDQAALWAKYGGYWYLKGPDEPKYIAQLAQKVEDFPSIIAVRRLSPRSEVVTGLPSTLSPAELQPLVSRLPARDRAGKPLLRGLRYGKRVVDLFVGYPTLEGKTIRAVRFKRYSFVDHQLLGVQEFHRDSTVPERAEADPPTLSASNWHDLTSKTVGFIRLDGGKTYYRVAIDEGFEGINYRIETVESSPRTPFEAYHYTPH